MRLPICHLHTAGAVALALAFSGCGDDPCTKDACSGHGSCQAKEGEASCSCEVGYAGSLCSSCADGYRREGDGCVPTAGDTCASAIPIEVGGGITVDGSTTDAADDYEGTCQSSRAGELVYTFSVAEPMRLRFEVNGYDSVMYLRTSCDDETAEVACNDDGDVGTGSMIESDLSPGAYYLFIDGYDEAVGEFWLTISMVCAAGTLYDPTTQSCIDDPCLPNPCVEGHKSLCTPELPSRYECGCDPGYIDDTSNPGACIVNPNPTGANCAEVILLPNVAEGTAIGTTEGATDNGRGTCGGDGPDRIYAFILTETTRVSLAMSGYDTVLHIRTACAQPESEVACNDDFSDVTAGLLRVLDPGVYFVFADGYSLSGEYTLEYSMHGDPCAGDPCPGEPECVPSSDWSTYACACPAGTLPSGATCVDDPCLPNPCTDDNEHRCTPVLPASYSCACDLGYIADGGGCAPDPNATDWLVMLYLNGDNDLETNALDDVEELAAAGANADVRVVALLDTITADGGHARDIAINEASGYDVLADHGELDLGDWHTLADFTTRMAAAYPARHYALIMWDHGDGWRRPATHDSKRFSFDESGGAISVANGDYAAALAQTTAAIGHKLDLVGFDACLMGMWEVGVASAPFASVLVASEETIPISGWSYDAFMPTLLADPNTSAAALGTSIVDTYYANTSANSTLSVVDLDSVGALNTTITAFADALRANPSSFSKVDTLRDSTLSFADSDSIDLYDFASRIASASNLPEAVTAAAQDVVAQLNVSVLYNRAQSDYDGAHGMAIYLPPRASGMDDAYLGAGATWSTDTTWDELVLDYTN